MITTKKNDFLFLDSESHGIYGMYTRYFIAMAGGRIRIPLWLFWTSVGIVFAALSLVDFILFFATPIGQTGYPVLALIFGIAVGASYVVYWVLYGLVQIVKAWIKVFRRAL